jgi:HlyD family secretion protein
MRNTARYAILALLLVLVYGLGTYTGPRLKGLLSGGRGGGPALPLIESRSALGRLQPSGGIISVVAQPGDRIEKLFVRQGQTVKVGDKLVKLASLEDREQELKLAEDQLADARKQRSAIAAALAARQEEFTAQLKSLEDNATYERSVQSAKVKALEGQAKIAKAQVDALMQLTPGVADVPREQMDKAKGALSQYQLELDAARTSLKAIDSKLKGQLQSLDAQKKSVEADFSFRSESVPLNSLEQKVKLSRLLLGRSLLTATVDGTVLKINNRDGDSTGPEPILQVAAGGGMVAVAEVYATDVPVLLGWLQRGGALLAEVSSPALGKEKLTGRLTDPDDVSHSVARNSVTGFNPRADSDRRIVEVRVALDEKSAARASKFIGLDVTVDFKPAPK